MLCALCILDVLCVQCLLCALFVLCVLRGLCVMCGLCRLSVCCMGIVCACHCACHCLSLPRDLNPNNVLVYTLEVGKVHVRVADFGLSRELETGVTNTMTGFVGSPSYIAPEVRPS